MQTAARQAKDGKGSKVTFMERESYLGDVNFGLSGKELMFEVQRVA